MVSMQAIDVRAVDLNLLKAFDALMTERAVTRAGARIGLSQPAMSHALTRLRAVFRDPLFVRSPAGMTPTPRAEELARLIQPALDGVRAALHLAAEFDPRRSTRTFTLGAAEYAEVALIEQLGARFAAAAPGATLRLLRATGTEIAERLDSGAADVVCAHLPRLPPQLDGRALYADRFVLLARRDHPALGGPLAREAYAALPHVLVSPAGVPKGGMDVELATRGLTRRVALVVASYLALPLVLPRSDLVATVPSRTAQRIAALEDLAVHEIDFAPPVQVTLAWHRRAARDPAQQWFRALVAEAAG
jgi:DNA-binding transcriptional LysR family regulator